MSLSVPGRFAPRSARGVTLLEMLLVIALIAAAGLLAAAAINNGSDGMRLRSAGQELAAELRQTRIKALASGQPQRFVIDPVARSWQGASNKPGKLPKGLQVRFTGAKEMQRRAGEGAIMFFPDGGASGGRVELQVRDAIWRIDVAWLTGQVHSGLLRDKP